MEKIKKKVAQDTPKTSLATIKSAGFSLLEVMIVVAIIGAIVAMTLPKINNRNNELRATLRKFSVLGRDLKNRAKLQNATYRIVISMAGSASKPEHSYWVERASGSIINDYDPKNPPQAPQTTEDQKNNNDDTDVDNEPKSEFSPDTTVFKRPQLLPSNLIFDRVELGTVDRPVTEGIVYIHFMPSGFADEAAIHLKSGDKLNWTIAINPLTSRADILDADRSLDDLRAK